MGQNWATARLLLKICVRNGLSLGKIIFLDGPICILRWNYATRLAMSETLLHRPHKIRNYYTHGVLSSRWTHRVQMMFAEMW
jgi:hypothetical protein